ncbi:MAG: hypothetical protein ACOYOH_28945, partial [Paracraurococcus sp.]
GLIHAWSFTLAARTRVVFDSLTNDYGLRWSLSGPGGTVVSGRPFAASDWLNIGGSTALDLAAGTWTLTVSAGGDATPEYGFRLLPLGLGTPLALDTEVEATLAPGNSSLIYTFTAAAGDRVQFDAIAGYPYNLGTRLYDPRGQLIAGPNYLADFDIPTLTRNGVYLLLVEGAPGLGADPVTIGFALRSLDALPADDMSGVQPINLGATVTGDLALSGSAVDRYSVTVAEGALLLFDGLIANGFSYTIRGPEGEVAAGPSYGDSYFAGQADALRLDGGTYVVSISGGSGTYAFRLLDLSSASPLTPGIVASGRLDPATSTDLYSFTAAAGDRFVFDALSVTAESHWRLFDPDGRVVQWRRDAGSDFGAFQVATAGTYTLAYEGIYYATGTNDYSFRLGAVQDEYRTLAIGATVDGSIDQPGQTDVYGFDLAAPATLYLDALAADTYAIAWYLSGPDGTVWDGQRLRYGVDSPGYYAPVLALPAGSYTLVIRADATSTGSYGFRLLDLAAAEAYLPGTVVDGSHTPQAATSLYS